MRDTPEITIDVTECARCEGDHESLTFFKLVNPAGDDVTHEYTHWAYCPTNGQPILLGFWGD